ncbi:hypothetical protein I302_103552 [Kwoniella bestiolae CBS 10118]|uniref:Uncharacterized protein n=1 Tax=Kwoniella bestiolae CBS 10118 TaxID=1296100 RepID=A0A1B9G8R4_9TREE|nr:hypothetical protein I302_02254 [Kwoniella bestiolae CBS 10118]OCF27412.1 hypothetical protein I302_02254 [Kwoniella bestiolae CBS 10118]
MLQTLKDSLSRLSLSLKDEDDTIITVRECPDTLKDITQLSWPAIEAIMKNGPKAKASRRLFRDLKTSWKEARREKKFDLDRDLGVAPSFDHKGRKVNMKETILLTAWTQSYMGTPKDEINDITRCLSNDTIWPEFKGEDRET